MEESSPSKAAAAEQSEIESRLRDIADQIPGLVFQLMLKKDGTHSITFVCERSRDLLGIMPEKIMQTPEVLLNLLSSEEQAVVVTELLESAKILRKFSRDLELNNTPCKWLRVEANPRRLQDGSTLWNGVALDISDRKNSEEELSKTRAFLNKVLSSIYNAVFIIDPPERIIRFCNPAVKRIFGYEPLDLVGQTTERLYLNHKSWERFADLSTPALERKGWFRIQYQMKRIDGKVLTTEHTVTPVYDESGWESGLVSIVRDVTERERAQKELKKLNQTLEARVRERTAELERRNQELQEFAFVASHDLREPLRKIQLFGEVIRTKKQDQLDEEGKDYLLRMEETAKRMQHLLDGLLRYSRITTHEIEFRKVDLNQAVREAEIVLETAIANAGVTLEIANLPTVCGDPEQLRQLFHNLLENAVKFRRAEVESLVKVYATSEQAEHRIIVEDNGIGFDDKYLDKIFQPFQRLHGRNEFTGIGIGLAICRKIADRHGGTITARSIPGKGSVVIITLPATRDQNI